MSWLTLRPFIRLTWCEFCFPPLDPGSGVSSDLTNQEQKSSPNTVLHLYMTVEVSLFPANKYCSSLYVCVCVSTVMSLDI